MCSPPNGLASIKSPALPQMRGIELEEIMDEHVLDLLATHELILLGEDELDRICEASIVPLGEPRIYSRLKTKLMRHYYGIPRKNLTSGLSAM